MPYTEIEYGGPYTHELDAIRDERVRASLMNEDPDFDRVFDGVPISSGAEKIIEDILTNRAAVKAGTRENVISTAFDEDLAPVVVTDPTGVDKSIIADAIPVQPANITPAETTGPASAGTTP